MNGVDGPGSYLSALIFSEGESRILSPTTSLEAEVGDREAAAERIKDAEHRCLSELDGLRREAHSRGYQAGVQQALEEMSAELGKIKQFAGSHKSQVGELVMGCLEKICGQLPADVLVPAMVERALQDSVDEIQVVVRVNPDVAAALEARDLDGVKVEIDPNVGATDCALETADCIKDIGLKTQMSVLQQQFNLA